MRSFKKIAAMIMAVAMLCSFTALAADVALLPVDDADSDNTMVKIGYDWDETTAAQTTMLVYRGEALEGADVVYINQFAENADPVTLDLAGAEPGKYTVVAGGMDVATAAYDYFDYKALTNKVTVTWNEDDGFVEHDYRGSLEAVNKGATINFTFTAKKLGFIPEVTVDGVVVPVKDGKLTVTVDTDMVIDVAFEEAVATDDYQSFNGAEIHDFAGDPEAEANEDKFDSKLMFGKAIAPAGMEIAEVGMYLEKWNGSDWEGFETETTREKFGPYYKADNRTDDNKYGIRFIRFNKGTYRVKSYVKYGDEQYAYGKPVEFEVK